MNAPAKKKQKRARSDEAKEQRRRVILSAARRLFEKQSYDSLTVDAVARASRLAKGTVYLYFSTKEAIFLELMLEELDGWFAALAEPLARVRRGDAGAVADLFAVTLDERRTLRRLFALLHVVFEQNADRDTIRSFKVRGAQSMGPTAARLEQCLPFLESGDGFRLLVHLHALVVGVGQLADESDVVKEVLADPALATFHVDFVEELRELAELSLRGWAARKSQQ